MVAGQPGGTAERATLLNFLTQPGTAQGPSEALEKLRKYSRWRSRAEQLQVSLPDPSLLLRAVESIVAGIVGSNTYRELAFRLSVLKLELSLDHVPTHEKVEKFRKQVHAEMELLAVSAQAAAQEDKEKRQRVRKVKTAGEEGKDDKPEPRKGKDCATCLRGCDLSGPYANGNHERLKKVRYCLHAVLTVPVLATDILKQEYDYEPSDPGEGEKHEASALQVEPFGEDDAELSISVMKPSPPDVHEVPGAWEFPEEGDEGGDGDDGVATGEVPLKEVHMHEVPYLVMLPDKKAKTVTNALKEVLADIAYWALPVRRVHTDKGAEFTNAQFRQLLADHQLRRTTTVGSDFKANGRTEAHIGRVKGLTRALLASASVDDADWAFAMRHAVFSMRSQVFTVLGFPQREPIPFYTKVWVRKKEWTLHLWAPKCIEARVMAPSESAPGGYVVRLQPSHPSDLWDGLQGYFETTALIQGVRAQEPVFEASGEVSVIPPSEVRKGVPVTEEASKTPTSSGPPGPSSRLRRKTPDPLCIDLPHAVRALADSLEALSEDFLRRGLYDSASWSQVLRLLPHKPIRRGFMSALGPGIQYRSFGMFTHGGVLGVTTASRQFPHTQRYLLAVLQHYHPQATFTSFVASVNCSAPIHRDYFNAPDSLNYVVGGEEHSRGGLWIEVSSEFASTAAPGVLQFREVAPRRWLPGMMWDTVGASFSFSPHRFHAGNSWSGDKYLLVAFTLKRCVKAPLPVVAELTCAGFPLPSCCPVEAESDFSEEAYGLDAACSAESKLWFEAASGSGSAVSEVLEARSEGIENFLAYYQVLSGLGESPSASDAHVKRELPLWKPAISAEYDSLRVKGGSAYEHRLLTYAGGIDASALRLSLAFISQHPDWDVWVTDVKTAFLNAKLSDGVESSRVEAGTEELIVLDPPRGIVGLLVVYVDDLMIGGVAKYASAVLVEIRNIWQCSEPDQLSSKSPVRFCGVEIERQGRALLVHQASYIEDVVKRYEESLGAPLVETSCPFVKVQDPEEPEPPSPVALRKAQALAGELLWVSGKTRVDIVYGVARVTSLVSRCPELAFCYLKGTKRVALKYQCTADQPPHGMHNERRVTALPYLLESFTDASFAPAGDRSFEAGLVQVGRNLVFWGAGKQPFTALSTAECELLGVLEGVALTESLEGLVHELHPEVQQFPACQAFCDNLASISIASFESGNWRTRHLRVRSQALRERLQSGKWHLSHLKGEHMLADIATKVLPWARVRDLLLLCGYDVPKVKAQGKGGVEGSKQDDWSTNEAPSSSDAVVRYVDDVAVVRSTRFPPLATDSEIEEADEEINHAVASAAAFLIRNGIEVPLEQLSDAQQHVFYTNEGFRLERMHQDGVPEVD
ncbi:RE1 [Symbiodinium sp. CCMP2592]|nr:RE1 [Symbiodinium sp. CCMP2592]